MKDIEEYFSHTEFIFKSYQKHSNLHCLEGCGKCCKNPEIEVRPTEVFLIAMAIYREKIPGGIDYWLKKLKETANNSCSFYQEIPGKNCMCYHERPLICRAFGAFRYGKTLSVCKLIKEQLPQIYQNELKQIEQNLESIPSLSDEFFKFFTITGEIFEKPLPINQAVLVILERLVSYKTYASNQVSSI